MSRWSRLGRKSVVQDAVPVFAVDEARSKIPSDASLMPDVTPRQVRRRGYEYGIPLTTETPSAQMAASSERQQMLQHLHDGYQTCTWMSSAIAVIARTVTAGGLQIVPDDDVPENEAPPEPPEVLRLRRLMRFTNPTEDIIQLLRNVITDLMLFGDSYLEVVTLLGEPVALYILDATTMTVLADQHGEVEGYRQDVDGMRTATFTMNQVIHISLDAPRGGLYGVSPAQLALLPTTAWIFTMATIQETFRRGDPPRMHVDLAHFEDTDVQRWREQYQVYNLGPKAVGNPLITTGGGAVTVLDPRKVTDYLDAERVLRDQIISAFGVPPSKVGVIETGNIGGGSGEAQNKSFQINTVIPVANLLLEKLNYTLVKIGFKIQGWHFEFAEVDFRDSITVEQVRELRLKYGAYCADTETEILTSTGWVRYDRLAAGDSVLTLNHETGMSEWQLCQAVNVFAAEEREMVQMRTRVHSSLTTPEHRWPVERWSWSEKKWTRAWTTSEEIRLSDKVITGAVCADLPVEAVHTDAFVELIGWFWTEGHAPSDRGGVSIYQVKPEGVERIRTAMEKHLGPACTEGGRHRDHECTWIERVSRSGKHSFRIGPAHAGMFRSLVPDHVVDHGFLKELTRDQLELFVEVSLLADGCNAKSGQETLAQKRREASERFQFACILAGRSSTLRKRTNAKGYVMWEVSVRRTEGAMPIKAARRAPDAVVESVTHQGIVWCPTTPNGTWLARREGTVFFTGNSVNDWRAELGKQPIPGGDTNIVDTRTGIVAWEDMEAMSKASIANKVAPLAAAGVNDYVPGVPEPDLPPVPPPDLKVPKVPDLKPNQPRSPDDQPGLAKDAKQGTPPKESVYESDRRSLEAAWGKTYRARRREALKQLPGVTGSKDE